MPIISNAEEYATIWDEESQRYEALRAYSTLTKYLEIHSPNGKILEFGCGTGLATRHLAENHEVLGLDNNVTLLEKARINLESHSNKVQLHQCDFFDLTEKDIKTIQDFAPDVVIGWNIGTSGHGQEERASKHLDIFEKPKDYREKVEDIIMKISGDLESVEIINIVCRGQLAPGYDFQLAAKIELQSYDKYVFDINEDSKFKGKSSKVIEWECSGSNMNYVSQGNTSNRTGIFTSLIAERKQ